MTPEHKKELREWSRIGSVSCPMALAEVLDALDEAEKDGADITKELVEVSNDNAKLRERHERDLEDWRKLRAENSRLREVLEAAERWSNSPAWHKGSRMREAVRDAIARAENDDLFGDKRKLRAEKREP